MSKQVPVVLEHERADLMVGSAVRRIEDQAAVLGRGRYTDDITPANCLYMSLYRSNYAHATIKAIDVSQATKLPGVVAVFSGAELKNLCKPIYCYYNLGGMKTSNCYPLAVGKVRFVGEPVVAVVASSREVANDALELVSVDYEPLPVLVDAERALEAGAPLLYNEWGDNLMLRYRFKSGDIESSFEEADRIFREKILCHRHSPAPMEPSSYVASYEPTTGLTVWASTQNPHILRTVLAETAGIPEPMVRVIAPDVGGGFGGKMPVRPEEILVSVLAAQLNSAVKYTEERTEHLLASHQAREQTHYIEAAVKEDGTILAIRDRIIGNLGIFFPTCGPPSLITTARFIPGCYKIRNYEVEVLGAATNKAPYGAYRGYGKDAANYFLEKLMDVIARGLKIDPVELRMKNIVQPDEFPYRSVTGALYDSGDYGECLRKATDKIEYEKLRIRQEELRREGRYIGIGISLVLEPAASHFPNTFLMGFDGSTVRLEPTGKVSVLTGVTSTGTGSKTTLAQIVSDELGIPIEEISVIQGDTSQCPYGYGTWASRGIVVGGNSVLLATRRLKERILKLAAHLMNTSYSELSASKGVIRSENNSSSALSFRQVALAFYALSKPIPTELLESGLQATVYYMPPTIEIVPDKHGKRNAYATYANSTCIAVVEVDIETGSIRILRYVYVTDVGRIVNPLILDGQIIGGIIQGIGGVLYEQNLYNQEGQQLCNSFMDYLLPSALEAPNIEISHLVTPSPVTPLGAKGAGEGPIEGVYATLANAVEDALEPFGIQIRELPLTPERIWAKIQQSAIRNKQANQSSG